MARPIMTWQFQGVIRFGLALFEPNNHQQPPKLPQVKPMAKALPTAYAQQMGALNVEQPNQRSQ